MAITKTIISMMVKKMDNEHPEDDDDDNKLRAKQLTKKNKNFRSFDCDFVVLPLTMISFLLFFLVHV